MIRLSDGEREYIRQGIRMNCRADGRPNLEYRHVTVECGVIEQASGSARVVVHGDGGGTEVLAAVKCELGAPLPGHPDRGVIEAEVESFMPLPAAAQRRAVADAGQELSANLSALLSGGGRGGGAEMARALCLSPGAIVWRAFVDVVVLRASAGGLADACALAACAALRSAELPRLRLVRSSAGEGGGAERIDVELADDDEDDDDDSEGVGEGEDEKGDGAVRDGEETEEGEGAAVGPARPARPTRRRRPAGDGGMVPFPAASAPVHVTLTSVGGSTVVDATAEEESLSGRGRVRVGVRRSGEACLVALEAGAGGGVGPSGGGGLDPSALHEALEAAGAVAARLHALVDAAVEKSRARG